IGFVLLFFITICVTVYLNRNSGVIVEGDSSISEVEFMRLSDVAGKGGSRKSPYEEKIDLIRSQESMRRFLNSNNVDDGLYQEVFETYAKLNPVEAFNLACKVPAELRSQRMAYALGQAFQKDPDKVPGMIDSI